MHPFVAQLERAAGFARDDAPSVRLEKLKALVAPAARADEDVALIADLLSLPRMDNCSAALDGLTPQRKKERLFHALLQQFESLARQTGVLMIFEDVHWIDPTSRELLDLIIERAARAAVLLVVTFRPEFQAAWVGAHLTTLTLNRLDQAAGTAMVEGVAGRERLSEAIVAEIVGRTDGVPLFVEELTKAVLEAGGRDALLARTAPTSPTVPATLHASLMARLDRLGAAAKEIAQVGAVIGREFPYELAAAVAGPSEADLLTGLDKLTDAGLVFRRGTPPDAVYLFKHALIQEVAYGTVLRGRKRELHASIAAVLQERSPEIAETQPEVLAHHFTEAGLAEQATAYWRRAGERAVRRSANVEAVKHFTRALELLATRPETPERLDEELKLQLALAVALIATKGYAAVEVEAAYRTAQHLSERLGKTSDAFPIVRGLWNCNNVRGELRKALPLADRVLAMAEKEGDPLRRALGHRALGTSLYYTGQFTEAIKHVQAGARIDDGIGDDHAAYLALYGERAAITCRIYASMSLCFLGRLDTAVERAEEALGLARTLASAPMICFALHAGNTARLFRHQYGLLLQSATEMLDLATEHGVTQWRVAGLIYLGFARVTLGRHEQGLVDLERGIEGWSAIGARLSESHLVGLLAAAQAAAGRIDEALCSLDRADAAVGDLGEHYYEAELLRLRAEFLRAKHGSEANGQAERLLGRALARAETQRAKFLQLRTATSLARLWRDQGKRTEARDLLAPVYGWFTEGLATQDLKEAKALLNELCTS